MKYSIITLCLVALICLPYCGIAQNKSGTIVVQGKVTEELSKDALIGVSVSEIDATNRVVNGTVTDIDGNYVIRVNNINNKLSFSYIGLKKKEVKIGDRTVINITMQDDATVINEVSITATRKSSQGGYVIPTREVGTAIQTISAKEFEGLQVTSIDDALQGRIAGLDIVANSSDPGSATSMRIRGVSSINGDNEPLIVLNGIPYSIEIDKSFDFASSNSEQYANMLSINPDDILEISVLKDAAASAIWGSKGANGVIMITTKKGATGKTKVEYSYRYTHTKQPAGRKMLTGDDYTMYIKEAYLNPRQDDNANNKPEYNYDQNYPDYENFNNNTDWVSEVTQTGHIHDHYLTVSGGGDRAIYRVSGGYLQQDGTIIGQEFQRFSSRAQFEYAVSDRIRFTSEFSFTYSDNDRNYDYEIRANTWINSLGIAYIKMPNVSVYKQDQSGNNTNEFYNIPRNSTLNDSQKYLRNPVAMAMQATNRLQSTRILPVFALRYDLLDPNDQMLRLNFNVSFDTNNDKTTRFLPSSVSNLYWDNGSVNRAEDVDDERLNIFNENSLLWMPKFSNKDHSMTLYEAVQFTMGNGTKQGIATYGLPSGQAIDASNFGFLEGAKVERSSWRNVAFMTRAHYAYKGRYIIDGTIRTEGSTRFGPDNRWGNFPGLSLKWIISDEEFMEPTKKWLSMLALRPSWGISGNSPDREYLHFSRYSTYGSYMDMPAVKPNSLRLNDLKWEKNTQYNYGAEIGLFDDAYYLEFNYYTKHVEDLLFKDVRISSVSGFPSLSYINGGTMDNEGWEINLQANRFVKVKDFSMDFTLNLANNINKIDKLDQTLLDVYNSDYNYQNGSYITRIQEGNSFGSIYGFRYKGTYKYDKYETAMREAGTIYDTQTNKPLAPFATDASGNVILDQNGKPKPIYFHYNDQDVRHQFRGGDAIYEDINNDGIIDELDIVYLGNCNPKLNGGFGPTFRYKNFSCKLFFNFRYGNKIVNTARMDAENMYYDNNQSTAVNWRWRKDGDETNMPRALYNYGYNWLGSDRYVEDGSFLRFKYLTFNYAVPSSTVSKYGLNKLSFYLTFNNLYIWSKYKGVDPEIGYGTLENKGLSYDRNSTPRTKDFTLGISVGF